jgi:hypothetical protein
MLMLMLMLLDLGGGGGAMFRLNHYLSENPDIAVLIGRRTLVILFEWAEDGEGDEFVPSVQHALDVAQDAVAARAIFVCDGPPAAEGPRLRCRDDAFVGYIRKAYYGPDGRRAAPPTDELRELLNRPPFTRPEPPALISSPRWGHTGTRHELRRDGETTIGSDPSSSIVVARAAPTQAILTPVDNAKWKFVIRDARGDGGLSVNGRPTKAWGVEPGERIKVADREFLFIEFKGA